MMSSKRIEIRTLLPNQIITVEARSRDHYKPLFRTTQDERDPEDRDPSLYRFMINDGEAIVRFADGIAGEWCS